MKIQLDVGDYAVNEINVTAEDQQLKVHCCKEVEDRGIDFFFFFTYVLASLCEGLSLRPLSVGPDARVSVRISVKSPKIAKWRRKTTDPFSGLRLSDYFEYLRFIFNCIFENAPDD